MTMITKRASELKVGDVVNPPYSKSVCTVRSVKMCADAATEIYYEGIDFPWLYGDTEEFTYLGSKKEDNMLDQLCVYLDDLAEKEKENNWCPLELREQLIEVYALFCGVFDINLNDVKKLYFERKMSSVESKVEELPKTKLVGSLKTGEKFEREYHYYIIKKKTKPKFKRVSESKIGDKVMLLIEETYQEVTISNIVDLNNNNKFVVCFVEDNEYQIQIYSGNAVFHLSDS